MLIQAAAAYAFASKGDQDACLCGRPVPVHARHDAAGAKVPPQQARQRPVSLQQTAVGPQVVAGQQSANDESLARTTSSEWQSALLPEQDSTVAVVVHYVLYNTHTHTHMVGPDEQAEAAGVPVQHAGIVQLPEGVQGSPPDVLGDTQHVRTRTPPQRRVKRSSLPEPLAVLGGQEHRFFSPASALSLPAQLARTHQHRDALPLQVRQPLIDAHLTAGAWDSQ